MHRRVMDALVRPRGESRGQASRASSPISHSARDSSEILRRGLELFRGRPENITLQSAGPSHDTRDLVDFHQRNVVSEGESLGDHDAADSDTSSDDYGETEEERRQRLFVGAGGLQCTQSGEPPPGDHDLERRSSNDDETDRDYTNEGGPSIYAGSDSSESAPVEIRRRRPTVSSVYDGRGVSST
jgi:hypothetical protein